MGLPAIAHVWDELAILACFHLVEAYLNDMIS